MVALSRSPSTLGGQYDSGEYWILPLASPPQASPQLAGTGDAKSRAAAPARQPPGAIRHHEGRTGSGVWMVRGASAPITACDSPDGNGTSHITSSKGVPAFVSHTNVRLLGGAEQPSHERP